MFNVLQFLMKKALPLKKDLGNNIGEIDNYLREEMQNEMGYRSHSVQEIPPRHCCQEGL